MSVMEADEYGALYEGAKCPRCHDPISGTKLVDGWFYYCTGDRCTYTFWQDQFPTHDPPVWSTNG